MKNSKIAAIPSKFAAGSSPTVFHVCSLDHSQPMRAAPGPQPANESSSYGELQFHLCPHLLGLACLAPKQFISVYPFNSLSAPEEHIPRQPKDFQDEFLRKSLSKI
jgi:hypothetical protein